VNIAASTVGILIVLVSTVLIIFFSLKPIRNRFPMVFRRIPAISKLRREIGVAVEEGSGIHVSLGKASLLQPSSTSPFIGLSTLSGVGQLSGAGDIPPISTSGDGALAMMSQDVLITAARETGTLQSYHADQGQLSGVTPFSYVAGALNVVQDPNIKTNVLIGNFGPEAGLLTTASEEKDAFTLAASDNLAAQAVFYASAGEPLIGEELYAVPAYLQASPIHQASLRVQDILRWGIVAVLIGGAFLTLAGVL
jgi:hypothetical protein